MQLLVVNRAQKTSLWGWALGSVCTVVSECYELSELSKAPSADEGREAWEMKRAKAQAEINTRMLVLVHALFQVMLVCLDRLWAKCRPAGQSFMNILNLPSYAIGLQPYSWHDCKSCYVHKNCRAYCGPGYLLLCKHKLSSHLHRL